MKLSRFFVYMHFKLVKFHFAKIILRHQQRKAQNFGGSLSLPHYVIHLF